MIYSLIRGEVSILPAAASISPLATANASDRMTFSQNEIVTLQHEGPQCLRCGKSLRIRDPVHGLIYTMRGVKNCFLITKYCPKCCITYRFDHYIRNMPNPKIRVISLSPASHHYSVSSSKVMEASMAYHIYGIKIYGALSSQRCSKVYGEHSCDNENVIAMLQRGGLGIFSDLKAQSITSQETWAAFVLMSCHIWGSRNNVLELSVDDGPFPKVLRNITSLIVSRFNIAGFNHQHHECDKCKVKFPGGGVKKAHVYDGITMGPPRCLFDNCPEPLESMQLRFCRLHATEEGVCGLRADPDNNDSRCARSVRRSAIGDGRKLRHFYFCDRHQSYEKECEMRKRLHDRDSWYIALRHAHRQGRAFAVAAGSRKEKRAKEAKIAKVGVRRAYSPGFLVGSSCCGCTISATLMHDAEGCFTTLSALNAFYANHKEKPGIILWDKACIMDKYLETGDRNKGWEKTLFLFPRMHAASHKHAGSSESVRRHCERVCRVENYPFLLNAAGASLLNTMAAEQKFSFLGNFDLQIISMRRENAQFIIYITLDERNHRDFPL